MSIRVPVAPDVIRWACRRSRVDRDVLVKKFPKLPDWETGELLDPTFKQLEA